MIELKEFLRELSKIPSPSGYEASILSFLKRILASYSNLDITSDNLGNLIVSKSGKSGNTLMLVAHCDEIGFVVKYIDDSGFIRFSPIGGIDTSVLSGLYVSIIHQNKIVEGVIGRQPIHFSRYIRKETKKNAPLVSELWIDIGASCKEEVESLVSVGDCVTFRPFFTELENDLVASKSIDNRAGVASLLAVIDTVHKIETNKNLFFVFSVQEEIGLKGAMTAGFRINPDVCVAIDVTHATDYPGVDKGCFGDVYLGGGPSIPVGASFDMDVQNSLRDIARKKGISFQVEAIPGFSGTDIEKVQLARCGVKTGLISIPCRYMHTPTEVASLKDISSIADIIVDYCLE